MRTVIMTPHPGAAVRAECLSPHGLSVGDAARALGVTRQALNNLLNGHAGVSPEMAVRLEKAFGIPAARWLQRQLDYDLDEVQRRADSIRVSPLPAPQPLAQATLL